MSVLATDSGVGGDASPIAGNWTTVTNAQPIKRLTNTIQPTNLAQDCAAYYNAVVWPADHYAQMAVTVTGTGGGGAGYGVLGRAAAAAETFYRLVWDHAGSGNVDLTKAVAGAYNSVWSRTQAWSNGDVLRLEVQGTTLRAYINGVQIGADVTDVSIATGNAGVGFSSTETAASGVSWEGGDFGGGGLTAAQEAGIFDQQRSGVMGRVDA